ncbi:MAG: S8 family serine peptidase, partial [Pseudomonadota bacterium]|nr:S8 family serine peptidase [Pseudomonadota bacterium]
PTPTPTPTSVFLTSEYNRSTGPAQHGAITAWTNGTTGAGVTIGIVDSGIDTSSPEFAGRISASSRDVAGGRGLTNPDSDHGNNVALVAAAARDNTGMLGIAFDATIAMFRADSIGTCASAVASDPKSGCTFSDTSIAAGVNAAVAAGAKVINLSLGGSPPNSALRAAVSNAAANGVVVIISAGNDGASTDPAVDPNNPDPFAAGLRAAGNGNVIIAGSVDASNVISGFSNKAGVEQAWFLAARGERVCCVYENGVLKVITNPDGSRSVYVFSGTSFSAPQIAGAAALLRQAFPNLTAVQVVDLLLRTASDGGATGIDAIYGRGVLNITNAFAPQGATSLAGSTTAITLGDTTVVTSAPMGDAAGKATGFGAIVLDSYQRAYRYDLGAGVRTAQIAPRLAPALGAQVRNVALGNDAVSLAFSVDASGRTQRLPWQGMLKLSLADAQISRVLAGQVVTRISPNSKIAFGFAQGSDGLVAQLQGHTQPAFLIARAPGDDQGFGQDNVISTAWRHQAGKWGIAASAEHGSPVTAAPVWSSLNGLDRRRYDSADRYGVAVDRGFDNLRLALGASWLSERHSILGARLTEGLGGGGADSLFLDARGEWRPAPGWRLGAQWRSGFTNPRSGGAVASGGRMTSSAWSIDAAREGVFKPGDWLGLRMSQPLRVESGGIALNLPVDYSYTTLQPTFARQVLGLAPHGREVDTELAWRGPLWSGAAMFSLFYRTDPGHYAALPDDQGVAFSWSRKF